MGGRGHRSRSTWRRVRFVWLGGVLALLAFVAAVIINAPSASALYYVARYGALVDALPPAPAFRSGDRLLVVAPHPDDESLCCAGSIQQAAAAGAEVFIVWLTSGDAFEFDAALTERTLDPRGAGLQRLGERRIGEARAAAQALDVADDHLFFLGYPDGGLERLLNGDAGQPFRSTYTGLTAVGYADALSPGAAFTGENLRRDLQTVVARVAPTVVLAPSPDDRHPDHRAAGNLTSRILGDAQGVARARWWIVHGALEWPLPKGLHTRLPLYPPPRGRGLPWERVDLTTVQETVKLAALRAHRSQMEFEPRFMEAFVRRNELVSAERLPASGGSD